VSREEEKKIQDVFVDQLGAKYPLVQVDKKDVDPYGLKYFPSVYVIDPDGVVYSVPDDKMPTDQQIEELLARVSLAPKMPADARYDPVRAMWQKNEFGKLRDYLAKMLVAPNLDAAMKDVFTAQQELLQKKTDAAIARIGKLGSGPDYAAAEVQLEKIGRQWKGLPPADAAQKELARFGSDPRDQEGAGRRTRAAEAQGRVRRQQGLAAEQADRRAAAVPQEVRRHLCASQAEKDITQLAGQK
jgi:hypothetical protein